MTLPDDSGLHRLGDTVRTFVEKNFERRGALMRESGSRS